MSKVIVNARWCIKHINSNDAVNFNAVMGEVKEVFASRSINELKEEIGDVLYFSYCWLYSKTGINPRMYGAMGSVHKFRARLKVWKGIFEDNGYTFSPKYLVNGSNYERQHKVDAALALAHAEQAVTCPRCESEYTPVYGWYDIASIHKNGECDCCRDRYDIEEYHTHCDWCGVELPMSSTHDLCSVCEDEAIAEYESLMNLIL